MPTVAWPARLTGRRWRSTPEIFARRRGRGRLDPAGQPPDTAVRCYGMILHDCCAAAGRSRAPDFPPQRNALCRPPERHHAPAAHRPARPGPAVHVPPAGCSGGRRARIHRGAGQPPVPCAAAARQRAGAGGAAARHGPAWQRYTSEWRRCCGKLAAGLRVLCAGGGRLVVAVVQQFPAAARSCGLCNQHARAARAAGAGRRAGAAAGRVRGGADCGRGSRRASRDRHARAAPEGRRLARRATRAAAPRGHGGRGGRRCAASRLCGQPVRRRPAGMAVAGARRPHPGVFRAAHGEPLSAGPRHGRRRPAGPRGRPADGALPAAADHLHEPAGTDRRPLPALRPRGLAVLQLHVVAGRQPAGVRRGQAH